MSWIDQLRAPRRSRVREGAFNAKQSPDESFFPAAEKPAAIGGRAQHVRIFDLDVGFNKTPQDAGEDVAQL